MSAAVASLRRYAQSLEKAVENAQKKTGSLEKAEYYRDKVLTVMRDARESADRLEKLTDEKYWPFPTYNALLYGVE